ncbi:hypothetical protein SAMN05216325_10954 [Nitrosomonas marina]|uniref:Uncharacterized protein n=1 Tax=Nitrosomonas marina TaxID=917 RepID=A0A1H8EF62_9PROT|nr:hypothetical protein SAMN05216325_10954 [Nitrosomonas marina]
MVDENAGGLARQLPQMLVVPVRGVFAHILQTLVASLGRLLEHPSQKL